MLLGPFEVGGPAGPVALGATKQRLLLALLALRANEVVSSEQLIDGLWGERPPPTALKTVHGHVARVRRILESAGMAETLITREPGYFLQVDPDCIDARTFERRAEAGRRSLAAGDAQAAERTLGAALGLWRGDALADCRRESDAIAAAAVRLDELRSSAIEDHVYARLVTGHHAAVIGDLEELLPRHPLRERLWSSLMMALYLSQRQADALRAYQRARATRSSRRSASNPVSSCGTSKPRSCGVTPRSTSSVRRCRHQCRSWSIRRRPDRRAGRPVGRPSSVVTRRSPSSAGLWAAARDGARGAVLLGGEPGIGKTRLAAEVALIARG